MSLLLTADPDRWRGWCRDLGVDSPYYSLEYARLWAEQEDAECVGIHYRSGTGAVLYPVLKVDLASLPGGEGYVDLRTPYDFGGPLALGEATDRLLDEFGTAFDELVREWRVVTEFARLHPFHHQALPSSQFHAENYVVDLDLGYDAIKAGYHATFVRNVRKAKSSGFEIAIKASPPAELAKAFIALYRGTMIRVSAGPEYDFSDITFQRLLALPEMKLATASRNGILVTAALVLRDGNDLFYYLQASDVESRPLCPTNLLLDSIIRHGAESGRRRLHLGGGSAGLRRFKSQMATSTVPYSMIKRVHLPDAYRKICDQVGVSEGSGAFPAYRPMQLS